MDWNIDYLPPDKWRGHVLPIGYTSRDYYDVRVENFDIHIERRPFPGPVVHYPEEHDFPDRLYLPHWEHACAWGVVEGGELLAAIETEAEIWSNRLRVTELWVSERLRRRGLGHELMAIAKERARLERRRAVILETQSCNTAAIDFYRSEGFGLIGLDTCCYSNRDIARREVRLELGWFPPERTPVPVEDIVIRPERREDGLAVERLIRRAFWNKYAPGCTEHYLMHVMRKHPDYLPEISRVAEVGGVVVGVIAYTLSRLAGPAGEFEAVTFGPLAVSPEYQGRGIGSALVRSTLPLARAAGYPAVIITGEPDYYRRMGFRDCAEYGITTPDGSNFPAFMALELVPGALSKMKGKYFCSPVYDLAEDGAARSYDAAFPPLRELYFPCQL